MRRKGVQKEVQKEVQKAVNRLAFPSESLFSRKPECWSTGQSSGLLDIFACCVSSSCASQIVLARKAEAEP